VIDCVSRRHRKMRNFGEERVYPLTLCPNSDAVMIVVFAHKVVKRSAMSGAQSAP